MDGDADLRPGREALDLDKSSQAVAQLDNVQVFELLRAGVGKRSHVVGTHRDAERRREIPYAAVENELLEVRRGICGREGTGSQIIRVGLARGEIVTAGAIKRKRPRQALVLFLRK